MRSKKTMKDLAGHPFDPRKRYRPDAYYAPKATGYSLNIRDEDHWDSYAAIKSYLAFLSHELHTLQEG